MFNERKSGILVHPVSLPSKYGIGDLGKCCNDFIDFLERANQKLWQILPLGPTGFGDSPYQSFSAFAGNPSLISPDILVEKGYLKEKDVKAIPNFDLHKIEYGKANEFKNALLRKAYDSFKKKRSKAIKQPFIEFCEKNKWWLDDYCLFTALKAYFIDERKNEFESPALKKYRKRNLKTLGENGVMDCYYGACFNSWPEDIALHKATAVSEWSEKLSEEIQYHKFCQYEFFSEWKEVKKYANEKGIEIIGDIPIFVSADSADAWANRKLFYMDTKGYPKDVAGVPPDYFSKTGQLWGNPLYDWKANKKEDYKWWISRIENMLELVDVIRIDHFRAFESYWAVPYGSENAVNGEWRKGPNTELFEAIENKLGSLPIIAEDLGNLNDEVHIMRDKLGLPGMKILQFAFDDPKNDYLPHNYKNNNWIVYTGTHDNDTTIGWYVSTDEKTRDYFRRYLRVSGNDSAWDMIRLAMSSSAVIAIIPIQDIMNLGSEARMNIPGVPSGNWQFRYCEGMLTDEHALGLRQLTEMYNR